MGGSIWNPGSTPQVNAESSLKFQIFAATSGQTLFALSAFTYVLGVNSLLVFKNGELQSLGVEAIESTTSSFTLATGAVLNDVVVAIGFVGITAVASIASADFIVTNYPTLRADPQTVTVKYVRGKATNKDSGEGWYQFFSGSPPATYTDDDDRIIVPAGGDGSAAWLRATSTEEQLRLNLVLVSQAEAEAGTVTTTRSWSALRVAQAIAAKITAVVTGGFIKTAYELEADTNAFTDLNQTKLASITSGAEVNPEVVSQVDAEAGTSAAERIWTALRVKQAIAALSNLSSSSGTFTPTIVGTAGTPEGQTYSNQLGVYKTIGDVVFFQLRITLSGLGTMTGNIRILGLPFSAPAGAQPSTINFSNATGFTISANASLVGSIGSSSSELHVSIWENVAGTKALAIATDVTATRDFICSGFYFK